MFTSFKTIGQFCKTSSFLTLVLNPNVCMYQNVRVILVRLFLTRDMRFLKERSIHVFIVL